MNGRVNQIKSSCTTNQQQVFANAEENDEVLVSDKEEDQGLDHPSERSLPQVPENTALGSIVGFNNTTF